MTGQSSDEKFRLTYEACQKIYIHDLLEILVGHVFCCKCHLSPEWRVGRLSAGCRWMRCFLAGQNCSADRCQRIYTHITAHNSPIRKNTRFTWKIPTLRGSPSPERDPVSVGFLHTPNFAAFWPKPRKKRILGQCAGIMQTVLHLTPPPLADVRLLSKTEKNIEKWKDSGTMC